MIKKLLLFIFLPLSINSMSRLVLRCSPKQTFRLTQALTCKSFSPNLKFVLTKCMASIVADKDRKNYTVSFDLDPEYIGQTEDKQKESLDELFRFITCDEKPQDN